jgi:hypothetical protein
MLPHLDDHNPLSAQEYLCSWQRQKVPLHMYTSTKLHGVTCQNTVNLNVSYQLPNFLLKSCHFSEKFFFCIIHQKPPFIHETYFLSSKSHDDHRLCHVTHLIYFIQFENEPFYIITPSRHRITSQNKGTTCQIWFSLTTVFCIQTLQNMYRGTLIAWQETVAVFKTVVTMWPVIIAQKHWCKGLLDSQDLSCNEQQT